MTKTTSEGEPSKRPAYRQAYKHKRQHRFGLTLQQKKYAITALCLINGLLLGATLQNGHTQRIQQVEAMEAFVAPTPVPVQMAIQPVKAPEAVTASIAIETVQPTPQSAVAAASISRPSAVVKGDWDGMLQQYFGSAWQAARAIMMCESGGNANAVSYGGSPHSYGLFQIRELPGRPSIDWLLVPENSISYAARLYHADGWQPWTCKYVLGL